MEGESKFGVEALVNIPISFEKLPMLDVIADRLARFVNSDLRSLTSDRISFLSNSIVYSKFNEYILSLTNNVMTVIFEIKELNNSIGFLVLTKQFIFFMTNLLLGGWKMGNPNRDKAVTLIERDLIMYISNVILGSFCSSFTLVKEITCHIKNIEMNPRFTLSMIPPNDVIAVIQVLVETNQEALFLDLVLPYSTLEPTIELLKNIFIGDIAGYRSPQSTKDFIENVHASKLESTIELGKAKLPLGRVQKLKVGDFIPLDNDPRVSVRMVCQNNQIFTATMGHVDHNLAIQIEDLVELDE